jgi:hypothetical protein
MLSKRLVRIEVVDRDGAELLAGPAYAGELLLRGHNVMRRRELR